MNVLLNHSEVSAVVSLVTAQLLDTTELTEEARTQIRSWRTERSSGGDALDDFSDAFNETLATSIDESTRRRHMRGGRLQRETVAERALS